jgi:hypothetical protein
MCIIHTNEHTRNDAFDLFICPFLSFVFVSSRMLLLWKNPQRRMRTGEPE